MQIGRGAEEIVVFDSLLAFDCIQRKNFVVEWLRVLSRLVANLASLE